MSRTEELRAAFIAGARWGSGGGSMSRDDVAFYAESESRARYRDEPAGDHTRQPVCGVSVDSGGVTPWMQSVTVPCGAPLPCPEHGTHAPEPDEEDAENLREIVDLLANHGELLSEVGGGFDHQQATARARDWLLGYIRRLASPSSLSSSAPT